METWLLISLSLAVCAAIAIHFHKPNKRRRRLPPGPSAVPILGNLLWLTHSLKDIESVLRGLHARYGPVVTLRIGSRVSIFVSDARLAHQALVEHGAAFADRPAPLVTSRFFANNQRNISYAPYGPLWRTLRRNLVSETLHPSRATLFAPARAWVLGVMTSKLQSQASSGAVEVVGTFQFSMFCLLVLMCFGEKLQEHRVREIEEVTRAILLSGNLKSLAFLGQIGKHLMRNKWKTVLELRQRQKDLFIPLFHARREYNAKKRGDKQFVHCYVDSLVDLEIQEEGGRLRKLTDDEIVGLCSEFLNAGTDTTSTALQWIMAELVLHREVQDRLFREVAAVAGREAEEVREEDLQRMPYLKAVVMEGLRRHPPAHFVLRHAAAEDAEIGGYEIPKGTTVNFWVAEMGWDEGAWEAPMEFRPERFLKQGEGVEVDVTGSREIRMMPFGAGRRICAAMGLAMLHLQYFVANLVREFEWAAAAEGEAVDLAERSEFTVVMKHPLRARLLPRMNEQMQVIETF